MKKIITIEWLNRIGKDTQLDILVNHYRNQWLHVLYMRWSWARKWVWTSKYFDWESKYRQILYKRLYDEPINTNLSDFLRLKATGKLQREIYDQIRENNWDILFLNRNIITNHFINKQRDVSYSLEDTLKDIYNVSWWLWPIKSDLTLLLHTNNIELLIHRADITEDFWFRKNIIEKYYSLYNLMLKDINNDLIWPIKYIEADDSIDNISKQLIAFIDNLLSK
jgi:thymidylate kinase